MPEALSGSMGWGVGIGVIFLLCLFLYLYFLFRKPKRPVTRPLETWPQVERRRYRGLGSDSSSGRNYASPLNRDRQTGHENEDLAMIGSLASLASDHSDARPVNDDPVVKYPYPGEGPSFSDAGFRTGGAFGGEGFSSGGGDSGGSSSGGGDSGGSSD